MDRSIVIPPGWVLVTDEALIQEVLAAGPDGSGMGNFIGRDGEPSFTNESGFAFAEGAHPVEPAQVTVSKLLIHTVQDAVVFGLSLYEDETVIRRWVPAYYKWYRPAMPVGGCPHCGSHLDGEDVALFSYGQCWQCETFLMGGPGGRD